MNLKKFICNHKNKFAFRRYNDFEFIEYLICDDCKKILNTLKGFDEDIRG